MPIERCELPEGGQGYRWGNSGKCYAERADAEKQVQAAYANGYNGDEVATDSVRIALDRASVRRYDQDGHLFVEDAIISAACVSDYLGEEIPNGEELGFKRGQVYPLLRDPEALEASAPSFAGKPLLIIHRPVSADDHPHKIVVGAIGSDVRYEAPYLRASLSIWDKAAVDLIESGDQKSLSCGYYYKCIRDEGVHDGKHFVARMVDIQGNHCALVTVPRVSDAIIGDSAIPLLTVPETPALPDEPQPLAALNKTAPSKNYGALSAMPKANASLSRQALLASGALRAYLTPKMAADAAIPDLNPILKPVTVKNWKTQKPKIKAALDKALDGKLAQDADLEDLLGLLDALEDVPEPVAAVDEDPDEDDEEEKKRKAKEAAEKLKEAASDRRGAKDEKDDDDDEKKSAADEDDDEDDDEEEKKRKAKEAAEKLKEAAKDRRGAKDKAKGMDEQPMVTKAAMDAAIASAVQAASADAAKKAEVATIARLNAIADAREDVRPVVGALTLGFDSADAVYKVALEGLQQRGYEVDVSNLTPATYGAVFKALKPVAVAAMDAKPVTKPTRIAADSATISKRNEMFPNANRLRTH